MAGSRQLNFLQIAVFCDNLNRNPIKHLSNSFIGKRKGADRPFKRPKSRLTNFMAITHFNDANFKKDVLESDIPVLVDFWATWCGPCRMVAPVVEEIAKEYAGKLKVGKVDVDQNSKTATQFGIMSIPTIMIFKNGQVMEQVVGALSKGQLKSMVEANIK